MKILIIGSGSREYSIALAILRTNKTTNKNIKLYFAPGNGATSNLGENIQITDINKLKDFALSEKIELSIVGPEQPLVDGIVDIFKENNLIVFGPSKDASRLEGSKDYMKNFLKKYNILTAKYLSSSKINELYEFIDGFHDKDIIVVKADGLCAGKGVIICGSKEEAKEEAKNMINGTSFGDAGKKVIIEEFLDGYELSLFAICDGDNFKLLPAVQDHKRLLDGDRGPNTGGMGAYTPTKIMNDELYEKVKNDICKPTMEGMKKENAPFSGVLFIGLMIINNEPFVLEYNVRFGDPETQVLMPLITSNVLDMFYKASTSRLDEVELEISNKSAICVVLASKNYPYKSSEAVKITIDDNQDDDIHISFGGVSEVNGDLLATGGRVLSVVALSENITGAKYKAYGFCNKVHFDGKIYRNDIAYQVLG